MPEVKPFNKQDWINALLNPEATQTKHVLGRTDGSRCCLGVLCDLAVEAGVIESPTERIAGNTELVYDNAYEGAPASVVEWAGLRSVAGEYRAYSCLAVDNDDRDKSFAEIAAIIADPANKVFMSELDELEKVERPFFWEKVPV